MKNIETVKNELRTLVIARAAAEKEIERLQTVLLTKEVNAEYFQCSEYKQRNELQNYVWYLSEKIGPLEWHALRTKYDMPLQEVCDLCNAARNIVFGGE